MQSMDGSSRSGGRRLKDRLARLLRPANSLLRSPCSSSTSTAFTTTAPTTTMSTSSSSATATTTAAALVRAAGPFSVALDLLRRPPGRHEHKESGKLRRLSSGHPRRRRRHSEDGFDKEVRKLSSNPYGFTTDDDGSDDTVAFFSSRSLASSGASAFNTSERLPSRNKSRRHRQRQQLRRRRRAGSCVESCGVRDDDEAGFRPVVKTTAAAEEEVRKGLAVVKRSRDPYGDFRESMVEMIVERQVFGAAELERLLQSYLSLNAPRLHPLILQAFSDIWVVLHGG